MSESMCKKTFTKWANSHLVRTNYKITNLYADLRDDKMLIKLLEILSGERLPRPTKGKLRLLPRSTKHLEPTSLLMKSEYKLWWRSPWLTLHPKRNWCHTQT